MTTGNAQRWQQPPTNEIAVAAGVFGVLNRSDDLVLCLSATEVFTNCVGFRFSAYKRVPTATMSTYGFGRPESLNTSSSAVLIGFEWSDGSTSMNLPMAHNNAGGLHPGSGGGGPVRASWEMHLDHLPPSGPFQIITAWPYFDISEQSVTFDADNILAASRRVETLWEEPEFGQGDPQTPDRPDNALVIPGTGWFADHYDPTPAPPRSDGMAWRWTAD